MSIEFIAGAITGWIAFLIYRDIIRPIIFAAYMAWRRKK